MTLEIILWVVAWIVISEIAFIIVSICDSEDATAEWIPVKFGCLFLGAILTAFHLGIVFFSSGEPNYLRLVWELIIILGLGLFFGLNWLIVNTIESSAKKKARKKK